jgi:glycosyltransferase involved in cell wall biosynthesis
VATLDSVLHQTATPHEILVLDDGSSDDTVSLLDSYGSKISVFEQKNRGVASARNRLCKRAKGDLIAFLDHDDIWHPTYLEVVSKLFRDYPNSVAIFAGHVNFYGLGSYNWDDCPTISPINTEVISPPDFLKLYNNCTGQFASMSYCSIPKGVLDRIGAEPFPASLSGADDFYLFNLLPLWGTVVFCSAFLVAYRVTNEAQSANLLPGMALSVRAFQVLAKQYQSAADKVLRKTFRLASASRRRHYAKLLMGQGKYRAARTQLLDSLKATRSFRSRAKSLALLALSFLPSLLQPRWPSAHRSVHE